MTDAQNHWAQTMESQIQGQRERLRARDPQHIAGDSGAVWEPRGPAEGQLALRFWQQPLTVTVPDYAVFKPDSTPAPIMIQALVITYLLMADGTPRAGEWVAFRDLPDGTFYHQAYTGYTGGLLARSLGDDIAAFRTGAAAAGGHSLTGLGDAGFEFQVLPGLWLAAVYWLGDEDDGFPPQARVLFDRTASRCMILDGLAILGSQLARRILAGTGQ